MTKVYHLSNFLSTESGLNLFLICVMMIEQALNEVNEMTKVSIKQIAELSGVSVATVSRVINNNGRFSEATRKKVLQAIEETGYQTNYVAKSLRMQKSNTIGILVPDITNYFFARTVQHIEETLFEHGYSTIICNTDRSLEKEKAYLEMLKAKMIDGLIVISGIKEFDLVDYSSMNIPVVCIDRKPTGKASSVFIASNHYEGAYLATKHLLEKGVKSPVILMQNRESSSSSERLKGFKAGLKEAGMPFRTDTNLLVVDSRKNVLRVEEKTRQLFLKAFSKLETCDGIFSINDDLAILALDCLKELGIAVPGQVKLIGFDDTLLSRHTSPKLSSVAQDTLKLAETTCENLLSLIQNPSLAVSKQQLVPVRLVERETT